MGPAGDRPALGGSDPEVGRSGVENDLEFLAWCTDLNWAVELSVHVINDVDLVWGDEFSSAVTVLEVL